MNLSRSANRAVLKDALLERGKFSWARMRVLCGLKRTYAYAYANSSAYADSSAAADAAYAARAAAADAAYAAADLARAECRPRARPHPVGGRAGGAGGVAMTTRPILFSAPMVRAILAGTKTQTRRIVKGYVTCACGEALGVCDRHGVMATPTYARPGDRLWVRETWAYNGQASRNTGPKDKRREGYVTYAADNAKVTHYFEDGPMLLCPEQHLPAQREDEDEFEWIARKDEYVTKYFRRMRPSIHMPRWASRITLEVTGVRVERLQDISEADAKSEGVVREYGRDVPAAMGGGVETWRNYLEPDAWLTSARSSYRSLWESINGTGSWAANPCVWVVEFGVPRLERGER